jgi:catechol 2,3-dioxygenase-like lactoylglutathione lyase family enzyme
VSIEVPTTEVERMIEFWGALGFRVVEAPGQISEYVTWLERGPNQVHLIHTDSATVPPLGHVALVAEDFDQTTKRLTDAGFEVEEHDQLWGERRSFAIGPAGHRVEVMAAPPPSSGA